MSEPAIKRNLAPSSLTGALGTGGLYRTDWNSGQTIPYIDLQAIGITTGPDRHQDLTVDEQSKSRDVYSKSGLHFIILNYFIETYLTWTSLAAILFTPPAI